MGGLVSLLTRKQPEASGLGGQAVLIAKQAVPAAKNAGTLAAQQAVPLARTTGASVKQGASGAAAWATPYVGAARHRAAPWLEQSAVTLSENIAPMISEALISAARKIDYVEPKPRHRLSKTSVLAGSVLLTAAGAAAAISLRHRHSNGTGFTAGTPMNGTGESGMSPDSMGDGHAPAESSMPDADANGHPPTG